MISPKITKKLDIPLVNRPVNFVVFPTFQRAQITYVAGGEPKFCRLLEKHLKKHICTLQIDHNFSETILYIPLKQARLYTRFCPERQ